jgi:hypothetical protein
VTAHLRTLRFLVGIPILLAAAACGDGTTQVRIEVSVFQVRAAHGEEFTIRIADRETIRRAREALAGRLDAHPSGPILPGDGGFNAPWSWHFDPARVRMSELDMEICDGAPSDVEGHKDEYLRIGYCPWGARIVGELAPVVSSLPN